MNLLTGEWVLVSPHRAKRPWLGQMEKTAQENLPAYDPACYLCSGNERSGGQRNPTYTGTFVFDNDFASLLPPGPEGYTPQRADGLLAAVSEAGLSRVICFSPRHDLQIPLLPLEDVAAVVRTWCEQYVDLGSRDFINHVQIFENKGAMMGASNPHPHSQVWASNMIPNEPAKELARQAEYLQQTGKCLLCSYLEVERASGERIVAANEHFTALVPFWAIWPFEVLLVANRHLGNMPELNPAEVRGLADVMQMVTTRYDNLFEVSFPYSMGFHQTPTDGKVYPAAHFHAHYYPPLLRSATVRKFMVGFELLAMPQRDLTPETAAERLRTCSAVHYRKA